MISPSILHRSVTSHPVRRTFGLDSSIPLDHDDIPTIPLRMHQYDWGDNSVPCFVQMACLGEGRFISRKLLDSLTDRQLEFVISTWSANGVAHHVRADGIATMDATLLACPPAGYVIHVAEQRFMTNDPRIRHGEQIDIVVHGEKTLRNARKAVNEFLADVEQFGLCIR
ncbi:MAG TPA: hypothetical protein VNQ76_04715 [Planctomicrobium sp.]|nr:hypothetical protein [Planctomicrobium sp.]